MSKYLMGSTYFFASYPDFQSKDIDELELIETTDFKYLRHLSGQGRCLFQLRQKDTVEEYIQDVLRSNVGMAICKFLIPEFCREIGFTITDLPKLYPLTLKLGPRHQYLKIIFDAYLENNDFILTEAQRLSAYKNYKESRGI